MLVVPPVLHFKLGVINKIGDSLDLVVSCLDRKHNISGNESTVLREHLSIPLSSVGA